MRASISTSLSLGITDLLFCFSACWLWFNHYILITCYVFRFLLLQIACSYFCPFWSVVYVFFCFWSFKEILSYDEVIQLSPVFSLKFILFGLSTCLCTSWSLIDRYFFILLLPFFGLEVVCFISIFFIVTIKYLIYSGFTYQANTSRWLSSEESACSAGDTGDASSIPGRFPGVGSGNPLQYSCLGNPLDRDTWWASVQKE